LFIDYQPLDFGGLYAGRCRNLNVSHAQCQQGERATTTAHHGHTGQSGAQDHRPGSATATATGPIIGVTIGHGAAAARPIARIIIRRAAAATAGACAIIRVTVGGGARSTSAGAGAITRVIVGGATAATAAACGIIGVVIGGALGLSLTRCGSHGSAHTGHSGTTADHQAAGEQALYRVIALRRVLGHKTSDPQRDSIDLHDIKNSIKRFPPNPQR